MTNYDRIEGTMTLEQLNDSYDWREAFKYATDGVEMADVVKVVASIDGENDGPSWQGVFKLKDGRFMYLSASCDYTGWGCQEGGSAECQPTLRRLVDSIPDNDLDRLPQLRGDLRAL